MQQEKQIYDLLEFDALLQRREELEQEAQRVVATYNALLAENMQMLRRLSGVPNGATVKLDRTKKCFVLLEDKEASTQEESLTDEGE